MARSVKAAQYERTSRLRRTYDVQANLLGWTKLDVLAAYLTDEDQLVVFDKDERRLSGDALPLPAEIENARVDVLLAPAAIPDREFGPKWQAARERFGKILSGLDLTETSRADVLKILESQASALLRGIELIRTHNGPEWREEIGL